MKVPSVAIVGRPNVGKSTIFNKLIGKKVSIIEDTPGVTRDRIYGTVTHNNYKFHLIDTGGIDVSEEDFNDEIIIQANIAIEEAEIILFVVDGLEELNQNDYVIRDILMKSGKRVIAVGTTSCRVLETIANENTGMVEPTEGDTQIFIYPGYKFKCIDRLITNFHLPESTLIMLVSSLATKEFIMEAYNKAVEEKYRFFSFGDAMLIL